MEFCFTDELGNCQHIDWGQRMEVVIIKGKKRIKRVPIPLIPPGTHYVSFAAVCNAPAVAVEAK